MGEQKQVVPLLQKSRTPVEADPVAAWMQHPRIWGKKKQCVCVVEEWEVVSGSWYRCFAGRMYEMVVCCLAVVQQEEEEEKEVQELNGEQQQHR